MEIEFLEHQERILGTFKLKGLSRPFSMTCEPLDNENIFWPAIAISKDRFDALWNYCNNNWDEPKYVEIEYTGLNPDGTPINGRVVSIKTSI
mgnify:CR=1 FL=1